MGWHLTGSEEMAGAEPPPDSPSHRPSVSHDLDPNLCTRCKKKARKPGSVWCNGCFEKGKTAARASIRRQIAAGMPVPHKNWKPGKPRWWKASGCYRKDDP